MVITWLVDRTFVCVCAWERRKVDRNDSKKECGPVHGGNDLNALRHVGLCCISIWKLVIGIFVANWMIMN